MTNDPDPAGRRTRAFWHRFPKDDAWKACTLAYAERERVKLEPNCRNCQHKGQAKSGAEVSAWADVPMETPIIALALRLVCSTCGYPAGYLHLHNPAVKSHR